MVHQLITIAEYTDPDDTVWSVFDRKLEAALQAVEVAVSIRLRPEMGHGVELIHWLEGWNLRFRQQNKTLISIAENPAQQQCLELSHPNLELVYISSINEIPKMILKMTKRLAAANRNRSVSPDENESVTKTSKPSQPVGSTAPHAAMAAPATPPSEKSITDTAPTPSAEISPSLIKNTTATHEPQPVTPETAPSDMLDHGNDSHHPEHTIPGNAALNRNRTPPSSELDWTGYNKTVGNSRQVTQYTIIEISGEYRCNNCGATRMFCKGDVVDKCENRECSSSSASFTLLFDLF